MHGTDTMAVAKRRQPPTNTTWDHEYHTLRREKLFRTPPTDQSAYPLLQLAVNPHIESFNAVFKNGSVEGTGAEASLIGHGIADIGTKVFLDGDDRMLPEERNQLHIRYKDVSLQKCYVPATNKFAKNREILPAECRERHSTYRGKLMATFEYRINNGDPVEVVRDLGQVPIMVKSNRCHLEGLSPAALVERKEESEELGGYFIVNGIEKIIRLLQVGRRNFPHAINRPSFQNRGAAYTPYGIITRSVRPDETSQTNVLHYLKDGNITFRFSWRKNEFLIPVMMILKALVETNDREIFEAIVGPANSKGAENTYLTDRVELLLRTYEFYGLYSKSATRAYLGEKFRVVLGVPTTMSNYDVGTEFLRKIVLVHLGNMDVTEAQDADKFRMLIFMIRKLYALVAGDCAVDNPDAVQNQEVLLGGFLYGQILKEKLDEFLSVSLRGALRDYWRRYPTNTMTTEAFARDFQAAVFRRSNENIGNALEYFLSTGNLISASGLDLQQVSGFTVVAEKLNFLRFLSHFRMIHRGSFFAQLKTTTVRKLLPESWGFLCPVHTPDGSPCGLLNHLAHKCRIITGTIDASAVDAIVTELGAVSLSSASTEESVVVMLDGRVVGWCSPKEAKRIADTLRHWKVEGSHNIPAELEIGYVPQSNGGSYPGVYMASAPSRMVRPVKYLALDKEDFVGPQEQPYMSIAVREQEVISGQTTHVELDPTNMLSILANMTPFSDFNQSPRNMYQCQMGKQTMGTPGTALAHRTDNKTYRLQTGQTPIVRAPLHNAYGFDNFPNGTNVVVAVISYTGYDMDDAMIINKSAHERGFGHGSVYKTKKITLKDDSRTRSAKHVGKMFGFAPGAFVSGQVRGLLDDDGLPYIGMRVKMGDPLVAWHTVSADYDGTLVNRDGQTHYEKYKDGEDAYVEEVRLIGNENGNELLQTISVKLRIPRSPTIGDKFSSRHGQKGVCSQKWPTVDMPFTESGLQPEVIINPHAFPSRMTIGMFIESLAGKAGALHGLAQDSTPFQFDEDNTAGDYFGHQLMKAGFNYHGNEPMYSGITGEELEADIYIGVVYYQRLRHMVNDKFQVRTTGPVVPTTGQPIKGRKRGGGIRVGEMERDALLAHGTAFLLQDRLLNCSDYSRTWICRQCGSFLSVQPTVSPFIGKRKGVNAVRCRRCATRVEDLYEAQEKAMAAGQGAKSAKNAKDAKDAKDAKNIAGMDILSHLANEEIWEDGHGTQWMGGAETTQVVVPGALKYLDVELAAMGVKLKYRVDPGDAARRGPLQPAAWDGTRVQKLPQSVLAK
ncbi:DNA-directed RNA polymerase 1 subunit beta [Grosmannia clavigera kw1407]|uniref:DNA-directed RNA polymerase subunit beta n=1 Tax=Grosmannia clavigera (strain kw1407 / UAMH 11150) TaxID=655863 RepID=F0X9F9_GROCL|nr:DNA-directed RNA polymerase 1 subunit beta [Grosmannia clavigera kw1407]EFX05208.1 DNA-directed RNA polymerase 1 subunit beta [Grosmannia clavigera kw1407]